MILCSINNFAGSLQPSITINTRKSFERIQTGTHQQEKVLSYLEEYYIIEASNDNNNGAPVDSPPHQPNDEDNPALNSEETDGFEQPYTTKFSDNYLADYCIVELLSSKDLGVSLLDFFPVTHVILNNVDWSLTVVNIGLCVMIYSFQLSNPNNDIKVCIITYVLYAFVLPVYVRVSRIIGKSISWLFAQMMLLAGF